MSNLTPCNYCHLVRIRRDNPGKTITLSVTDSRIPVPDMPGHPVIDGAPVRYCPEMIAVIVEGQDKHVALMQAITTRCVC